MPTSPTLSPDRPALRPGQQRSVATPGVRVPPDMQVVTKGWWTLREERRPVEELEQADRDERKRG